MKEAIFNPEIKPNDYYVQERGEMFKYIPQNVARVLDIGCSQGNFGRKLKTERNCEVWGIELSPEVGEQARMKLDKVFIGDIENDDIPLPKDYFDCIVFNDVLEHLKYPWVVLKTLRENLKNNGYVVASIPNVRFFYTMKELMFNKSWKYVDAGILDKTHLRFFTIKSIEDMFNVSGYRVVQIEGINAITFPWKFNLFNKILRNACDDMRFMQFACLVQKNT